jgi:hypothetical protein
MWVVGKRVPIGMAYFTTRTERKGKLVNGIFYDENGKVVRKGKLVNGKLKKA